MSHDRFTRGTFSRVLKFPNFLHDQGVTAPFQFRVRGNGNGKIQLSVPSRCRLRHERLKKVPRDVGGPSAYQTLTCFELEDTPALPNPPSSSSIDDPFDIRT